METKTPTPPAIHERDGELKKLKESNYILWQDYGYDGWSPTPFDTLQEALESQKITYNWIITEPSTYTIISMKKE